MFALRYDRRPARPTNLGEPLTGGTALFLYLGGGALLLSLFGRGKKKAADTSTSTSPSPTSDSAAGAIRDAANRVADFTPPQLAPFVPPGGFLILAPDIIQLAKGSFAKRVGGRWYIGGEGAEEKNPEFTPEWWRSNESADVKDRVNSVGYERCRSLRNYSTKQPNTKADCAHLISGESMEYCVFKKNVRASAEELNKNCAGKLPNDIYIAQDTGTYGW
jgi:hypothetical protein